MGTSFIHSCLFLSRPFLEVVAWRLPLDLSNLELHASTLGNHLSCVLSFGGKHNDHFYSNLAGLDSEEK